jgi:CRP-like cAMP-binding protein
VKVGYYDEKGEECIIKLAPEDWWVVDLDSFLKVKPAFYFMQAIEDTEVFQISKAKYDHLLTTIPQFYKFSGERWQAGFIALQQRLMQNLTLTAEEKYQHFREKYPGLEQRVPQKLIASYLGITPVFLSVLRKKWAGIY